MSSENEFLAKIPRRKDGKRGWPSELKAHVVAETLIAGASVKGVAKRYDLIPSTVSDWRRMVREGKLVLPGAEGMDFVPVEVGEPGQISPIGTLDVIKNGVVIRLNAGTSAGRIAEIVGAL